MDFQIDISVLAAIFSALAAFFSFLIAKKNFKHIKNKEAPNITITNNFNSFNSFIDKPGEYYKQFVKVFHFNIQNLSLLQIDLLSIEFEDFKSCGKKKLFKDSLDNPEFLFLAGATYDNPIIKKFQSYHPSSYQKFNYIEAKSSNRYNIPLFILQDFIQATYIMKKGDEFNIKRRANINIEYYDINRHKIVKRESKIIYHLTFDGARNVIHFSVEPKIIKLNKSSLFRR